MFWLKDKIEKNNKFYKKNQEKIRNQNNEDQNGKHNIINLNWMMKLKTNKTFTKWSRKKIEIQKIKTKLKNIIFGILGLKDKIKNI
jgi:hypothetical protein